MNSRSGPGSVAGGGLDSRPRRRAPASPGGELRQPALEQCLEARFHPRRQGDQAGSASLRGAHDLGWRCQCEPPLLDVEQQHQGLCGQKPEAREQRPVRRLQLEIEKQALANEADGAAVERRGALEQELSELREKSSGMKARWQSEKEQIERIQSLKERVDEQRGEMDRATREGDLERAAEIQYGAIPALEEELQSAEERLAQLQEGGKFLKEEVDDDDVATSTCDKCGGDCSCWCCRRSAN